MSRLCIQVFIDAGLEVMHSKKGQSVSKQVVKWLKGMTNQVCSLGGMMADGGDEHLVFTVKADR